MRSKFLLTAGLLLPAPWLAAQGREAPHVKISVHDVSGTPIPNAAVAVAPRLLNLHTGPDGTAAFQFTQEPAQLSISAPGYSPKTVELGLFSTIDVALAPDGSSPAPLNALTVVSAEKQSFSPADFAKLPHQSLTVTNGHTHRSETYSGVPLIALLGQEGAPTGGSVKGKALSEYVVATGSDGYKAVLSLAEAEPDFHSGTVLVADAVDGKPLEAKQGPFQLVVSEDTRPARAVHNLISRGLHMHPSRTTLTLFLAAALAAGAFAQQIGTDGQQTPPPPGFTQAPPPPQYDALKLVPLGLTALNQQASWHTDFTFDRSMLAIAGGLSGMDDQTRQTIARLNGVAVHLARFSSGYDPASIEEIRAQYSSLGWKHVVTANKFPDSQGAGQPNGQGAPGMLVPSGPGRTDVWLQSHGADFAGAAILLAGPTNVNLITVSGDIRTLDLLHLRGHFGIPRFPDDALSR